MGKENGSLGCLGVFAIVLAIPIYLIMEHPVLFFLVILPVTVLGIIGIIRWILK